jgi:asparagine synthase (glutamine-hydrolysing)
VRPWYLAKTAGGHAGASDVATLADLPGVDTGVDEGAAIAHLAAVFRSRGPTVYRGVESLRPGHTWVLRGGSTRTFAHHRWEVEPDLDISWDAAAERCRSVFDEAVRDRIPSDVAATADLSGGLDSSTVVGTLAQAGYDDLVGGRLLFDGPADERRYSDAVAAHWQIRMVSASPWEVTAEARSELTTRLRLPAPDPHFTMFVSLHRALLSAGRPESVTGLGGDDAFAAVSAGSRVVSSVQLRQWRMLRRVLGAALAQPRRAWPELVRPTLRRLVPRRDPAIPAWVRVEAAARAGLPEILRERPDPVTGIDAIDERLEGLTGGYDAAVLELRALVADPCGRRDAHPYLDPRLIHATYGLDPWWPVDGDSTRALQAAAFADRLPEVVVRRHSKAVFAEVFWPTLLHDEVLDSVRRGPLLETGWLEPGGFDALVERARRGMANAAIPLSRCVSVDHWLRSL